MSDLPERCAECTCEKGGVYCNWIAATPEAYREALAAKDAEIARLRREVAAAEAAALERAEKAVQAERRESALIALGYSEWCRGWGQLNNMQTAQTVSYEIAAAILDCREASLETTRAALEPDEIDAALAKARAALAKLDGASHDRAHDHAGRAHGRPWKAVPPL